MSERQERWLANAFAFVMTFLLLLFVQQATAETMAKPNFTQPVMVISHDKDGKMTSRVANIRSIPNAFSPLCFEMADHRSVQCFYCNHDGAVVVLETRLAGEEKT